MGMPAPAYYTAEMVLALPDDGNRYEVVYGELLVTPAPRPWHEEVQGRIFEALRAYLRTEPMGHVFGSRSDLSWREDVLVSPDLFVVPLDQARTLRWAAMQDYLLVVEVVSPSSTRFDRFTKRRLYQEKRVPAYWVVDADAATVEVWSPEATFPLVERERLMWHPAGAREPLALVLEDLFRAI
jgi:Uma2 family endonuclease